MAIHTGEADSDYRSPHVNRAARIRAIAHGEQILISGVTAGIVRGSWPEEREEEGLRLYGAANARLKDLQTTMADEVAFWMKFRARYVSPERVRMGGAGVHERVR